MRSSVRSEPLRRMRTMTWLPPVPSTRRSVPSDSIVSRPPGATLKVRSSRFSAAWAAPERATRQTPSVLAANVLVKRTDMEIPLWRDVLAFGTLTRVERLQRTPMKERNPQAEQMADESMLRNLAAQAEAIWPQEQQLFERYRLPARAQIADIGCGSGEITSRLAARYPDAQLVGVDILEGSVAYARRRYASLAPRVRFEQGDAFELKLPAGQFDLVVCRHMTQAVPEPQRVLAELCRICKPGGWVHVLSEDYGMIHAAEGKVEPDRLWYDGVIPFTHATGTDACVGRRTWPMMKQLGFEELQIGRAHV